MDLSTGCDQTKAIHFVLLRGRQTEDNNERKFLFYVESVILLCVYEMHIYSRVRGENNSQLFVIC